MLHRHKYEIYIKDSTVDVCLGSEVGGVIPFKNCPSGHLHCQLDITKVVEETLDTGILADFYSGVIDGVVGDGHTHTVLVTQQIETSAGKFIWSPPGYDCALGHSGCRYKAGVYDTLGRSLFAKTVGLGGSVSSVAIASGIHHFHRVYSLACWEIYAPKLPISCPQGHTHCLLQFGDKVWLFQNPEKNLGIYNTGWEEELLVTGISKAYALAREEL